MVISFDEAKEQVNEELYGATTISQEALVHLANGKRAQATEVIAQFIEERHIIKTTRDDTKPEMWIYSDGIYHPNGETYVIQITRGLIGHAFTSNIVNNIILKVRSDTYIEAQEFFSQQDNFPQWVPVQNGILDINEKKLEPFTSDVAFFNKLPVQYDPGAKCPKIQRFFREVMLEGDISVLQEFMGFSLLREYKYEKSMMLTGSGRNGKSKTLQLWKRLLGSENCASIPIQDLEEDQYAMSELHTKMVNIAGDLSQTALKNTGVFKRLTGRDPLQASRKFKTKIGFVNYAKMVFAANDLPRTNDLTNAFFDRWILIEFPYRFLPQDKIDALTKEDRVNVRLQNPSIIDEIASEQELTGLLVWALEGYDRLRENKDFSDNKTSETVKQVWLRKSDSFRVFCMDHIETDYNAEMTKKELRQAYHKYCQQHKLRAVGDKAVKIVLEGEYGAVHDRSSYGDRDRVWIGVKLKDIVTQVIGEEAGDRLTPLAASSSLSSYEEPVRQAHTDRLLAWWKKQNTTPEGWLPIEAVESIWPEWKDMKSQGVLYEPKAGYLGVLR